MHVELEKAPVAMKAEIQECAHLVKFVWLLSELGL